VEACAIGPSRCLSCSWSSPQAAPCATSVPQPGSRRDSQAGACRLCVLGASPDVVPIRKLKVDQQPKQLMVREAQVFSHLDLYPYLWSAGRRQARRQFGVC
jgi:hypothetical protein